MLTNSQIKEDLYRLCGASSSTARSDLTTAVQQSINRAQAKFALTNDWSFLEQYQDRVDIALAAPTTTGTVTVTRDSKSVTGNGTAFTKDMEGDYFRLTSKEFYEIRTWTSGTAITLAIPFQGASATDTTYQICKRFYPLPLNFLRGKAREAKLVQPDSGNSTALMYHSKWASFDKVNVAKPTWFCIQGNRRRNNYYDTGTVTISTTSGVSTWTVSTGTLPTDIVDREVRVAGESRAYLINARTGGTTFTTYDAYVNPSDLTGTLSSGSSYAITPKETMLIGFSDIPDQRYIFTMPYIKQLPDLLLAADVSEISKAGYDDAFLAMCRAVLAQDFRTMLANGVDRQGLINEAALAVADSWYSEQHGDTMQEQGDGCRVDRRQAAASWIG